MAKAKAKKKEPKKKTEWPKLQLQAILRLSRMGKVSMTKDKLSAETYTDHHLKIVLSENQILDCGAEHVKLLDRIDSLAVLNFL